ncbi:FAD-dependent oxidoreductase [Streptomyces sp. NPDC000151]|uniref:NAD(P)/FAD-dependent oxidoreductase n=1 Tax=Streptomyces sp. NPDC000151 TaxID=3154244 RepID=UPI00332C8CC6
MDEISHDLSPRPELRGDVEVDVAIVGAGFSGLWTAFYLQQADPSLRIAVLEAETAGYGGSGRNGGWCSAIFPTSWGRLAAGHGPDAVHRLQQAMNATVDEIGHVSTTEPLDCDFTKGGYVALARNRAQLLRAHAEIAEARRWGFDDEQLRFLDASEARALAPATNVLGATFTPHCAVIDPAKLTRNLARVVEDKGVRIYERTAVTRIEPGRAVTPYGTVRARHVVRSTEAYTGSLQGHRRTVAPVYALAVATEPLPEPVLAELGMDTRPAFNDLRHIRIWGQRTASGRVVFGGRGAPYHLGSAVRPGFDRHDGIHAGLRHTLLELFPQLNGVQFTHRWGGPVAIPRDWHPSVGLDRATGLAWTGPYVGDGVATANLAARILRDLILERDTELTKLLIANHRSPRWEPEPLRWFGINAGLRVMNSADRSEARKERPSQRARLFSKLIGGH